MTELWFYSGRVGNCMFMHAFTRIIGDSLGHRISIPKGTEITEFPLIAQAMENVKKHDDKGIIDSHLIENPRTIVNENDNMAWFIDPNFQGKRVEKYSDIVTVKKVLNTPDIHKKWLILLGNFEIGDNYHAYRNKLKAWFKFPEIDMTKFEFFKLHSDLGKPNWFYRVNFDGVNPDDLVISLRLEDYTSKNHIDRLLDYDYFKIILGSRKFNKIYIITNPSSIGHNDQYEYLKQFFPYDPIFVRIYDRPIMSMAFGASFNNIAISQSTYSWWVAFLSNAKTVYYPLPKTGPFSLHAGNKYPACDLRVPLSEWKYVDYESREILSEDYYKRIDYENRSWKI